MGKYTTQELKNIYFEAKERFSYVEDEDIMGYENIVKKVERVLTGKTKFCKFNIFEKDTISAMFTENDNVCIINETYDEYVNRYGEYADLIIKLYGVKVKSKVEEEPEATAETVESVEETTVSETVEETAEQETELNAEVAQVEAEQTEENNIPHTVNRGRKSKGDISMNHFESDKYNLPFAVRFRELCKDTATAAKLRQYLGVTSQTISQFKLGTTLPKTENLIRIADFFNVSVDYLLGRTNTASQDVTIQAVCSTTGLSQAAVEKLALWTSDDDKRKLWADYLSYYITSPDFEKALEYINKAHNCYNGDLNEDVIVKLWQVSRKIEVVTESLIELEEIPKTGYFDTS